MQANNTIQTDLRAFLAAVEDGGELKAVSGAHWDREIGALTEVLYREKVDKSPLLLFDDVPGYPKGMRCLYGMLGSPLRLALGLGLDVGQSGDRRTMLDAYRKTGLNIQGVDVNAPQIESLIQALKEVC